MASVATLFARRLAPVAVSAGPMGTRTATRSLATGTVKWFNLTKGFGFITPDETPDQDMFVHQTSITSSGFRFLREGERVNFDVVETDRGTQAANVTDENGNPLDREESRAGEAEY